MLVTGVSQMPAFTTPFEESDKKLTAYYGESATNTKLTTYNIYLHDSRPCESANWLATYLHDNRSCAAALRPCKLCGVSSAIARHPRRAVETLLLFRTLRPDRANAYGLRANTVWSKQSQDGMV